ncbi:MAG TPA: MFS transporter [Thermoleophilaceae bacterium]|nr:MFS transporter [Thermoleophilaceae bacterium]
MATVMPGFLAASLAPRIKADFAFGDSSLGLAVALFYVVSATGSVPAGRLVDRAGPAWGMRLAAAFTVSSCLAVALLADSAAGLTVLMPIGGVANALGGPSVSALLKREVAARRHGLAFGAQQAGAPGGALLAGLALPAVAIPFGWRWAFVLAAVLALVAVACAPHADGPGARSDAPPRRPHGFSSVHALGLAAVLASAAGVGFVSFLVTYAVDSGMREASAGLLLAGVSLMATASRVGLGELSDRGRQEPLRPVATMLAASVAGYLLLTVGEPAVIVVAALLAGGLGWAWPGGLNLAVVQRSPEAPAWAVGVLMTGLFVGAVGGPLVLGVLAQHDLFTLAWIACGTLALLAAATITATMRRERA